VLAVGGKPLGDLADVVGGGLGLLADGIAVALDGCVCTSSESRVAGPRRVSHEGERVGHRCRQRVQPPTGQPVQRIAQSLGRVAEIGGTVGPLRTSRCTYPSGGAFDGRRRQLVGRRLGDTRDQLVALVDDHRRVLGQHGYAVDGVDGQQRVVGDHHLGVHGGVASPLGEALAGVRAALRPEALAGADRHLGPAALGVGRSSIPVPPTAPARPPPPPTTAAVRPPRRGEPSGTSTSTPVSSGVPSRTRCRHA
jgi:hypothetical protein